MKKKIGLVVIFLFLASIILQSGISNTRAMNNFHLSDENTNAIGIENKIRNQIGSNFVGYPYTIESETPETQGVDLSLREYLGLQQIQEFTSGGDSNYKVVIFDHLIDIHHPKLRQNIVKAVLLPVNQNDEIIELDQTELHAIPNIFEDPRTKGYIRSDTEPGYFGHGTAVAGVVHQIAPNVDIISVAVQRNITFSALGPSINNFLKWLQENQDENFIINISSGWSEAVSTIDLNPSDSNSIANQILDQVYNSVYKNHLFICSSGNTNSLNIIYPANLANYNYTYYWTNDIYVKLDLNCNTSKAN